MSSETGCVLSGPLILAIIGAGRAGRSLAAEAVRAGHHVILEDVLPSRLRTALEEIPTGGLPGSLQLASEVEGAVRDADLAIDFVPDELESKLEIVSLLDRMAPPRTVFCIPTRSLRADDLASCTYRPERFVCMEDEGYRVTLRTARQTSTAAVHMVERFWRSLGRDVSISGSEANLDRPVGTEAQ